MARTPRPLTIATREATKALIAAHQDEFNQLVAGKMADQGFHEEIITHWTDKF